jgi:hypothetical protein
MYFPSGIHNQAFKTKPLVDESENLAGGFAKKAGAEDVGGYGAGGADCEALVLGAGIAGLGIKDVMVTFFAYNPKPLVVSACYQYAVFH